MSVATIRDAVPVPVLIGILALLGVSLAYAVVVGSIGLWFLFVAVLGTLTLASFLLYLFYRLVVAVERIAGTR